MIDFNILLFDDFETLDAFGPTEVIGKLPEEYNLEYYSLQGGIITSSQNVKVETKAINTMNTRGIILIPGGRGTRMLISNKEFISTIEEIAKSALYVLTVCTGSALLAKTNLLNRKKATSNKRAFEWVKSINKDINWIKEDRWVVDGKFYTSSGVSAGIDMTLGFVMDIFSESVANDIAHSIEYIWNRGMNIDPFSI